MTFKKDHFFWACILVFFFGVAFSAIAYHLRLVDLGGWDEVLYVHRGYFLSLGADWGPVYSLYYSLFKPFTSDPVTLFFFGRLTMQFILLPMGLFLFLHKMTECLVTSLVGALLISTSLFLMRLDPGIQIFNLTLWLYILNFLVYFPESKWTYLLIPAALGAMPFVRQDNTIYIASVLLAPSWISSNPQKSWMGVITRLLRSIIICTGAYYTISLIFGGSPFSTVRSLYAFADHFFWKNRDLFLQPSSFDRVARVLAYFGEPQSLASLLVNNYEKLIPYFSMHMEDFWRALYDSINRYEVFLFCAGLGILFIKVVRRNLQKIDKSMLIILGITFISFAKAAIVCILLSPQRAYYVELFVFFSIFIIMFAFNIMKKISHSKRYFFIGLSLAFLLVNSSLLNTVLQDYMNPQSDSFPANQFKVLRSVQTEVRTALPADIKMSSLNLFSAGNFFAFLYFNENNSNMFNFRGELNFKPDLKLNTFLNSKSVELVVLDENAREVAKEIGIFNHIADFEASFTNYGYTQIRSQNAGVRIFWKNQID